MYFFIILLITYNYIYSQPVVFDEIPQNLHFYARDNNNQAKINVSGKILQIGYDSIIFKVFRNNLPFSTKAIKLKYLNGQAPFSNHSIINSELAEYRLNIYLDNILIAVRDSIVCGDVYIINGQSNSHPYGNTNYSNEFWRSFGKHTNYDDYIASDTIFGLANGVGWINYPFAVGTWGIELQRLISSNYGIPVFILNGGSGGSSIEYNLRDNNKPANLKTTYGRLLYRAIKSGLASKVKAVFWHQGESNSSSPSYQYYQDNFDKLYKAWKEDYPNIKKVYIFQIHQGCGYDRQNEIREYQRNFPIKYNDISVMSTGGLTGHDGCHYNSNGYNEMASWIFRLVARDFYNSTDTSNIYPPNVLRVYYLNSQKTKVGIDFDQVVRYPDDLNEQSMKDYFYFDSKIGAVSYGQGNGAHSILLELNSSGNYQKLTYLPNVYYNNTNTIYNGPWVRGLRGIGALSFYNQSISENLEITKQPQSQFICNPDSLITLSIGLKGLIDRVYWQKSLDGGTQWVDLIGENNPNLTFYLNASGFGDALYRCIVKGEQFIQPDSLISSSAKVKLLINVKDAALDIVDKQEQYCIDDTLKLSILSNGTPEYYLIQNSILNVFTTIDSGRCDYNSTFSLNRIINIKEGGIYRICLINSSLCNADTIISNTINIKISPEIIISTNNDIIDVCYGDMALMSVDIANSNVISYQWFKNGVKIDSDDNSSSETKDLIINFATEEDESKYYCKVVSIVCNKIIDKFSDEILLKVKSDYIISNEYNNKVYNFGEDALIEVDTKNALNTRFKWIKNGKLLSNNEKYLGVSTNVLEIRSLVHADFIDSFNCISSAGTCYDTSSTFKLNINQPVLSITDQPTTIASCTGDSLRIEIIVKSLNCDSIQYKWFKNGKELIDKNVFIDGSEIYFNKLDLSNSGEYRLSITAFPGSVQVNSSIIDIQVTEKPIIIGQTQAVISITEGSSAELYVEVSGNDCTYSWFKNDSLIMAQTKPNFVLNRAMLNDSGIYFCLINNKCGFTKSENFTVNVLTSSTVMKIKSNNIFYPNPANSFVNISLNLFNKGILQISMINCLGIQVLNKEIINYGENDITFIDVSTIPNGIYILEIIDANETNSYKVLIIH